MPGWLKIVLGVVVVLVLVVALAGPIGPIPGLRLGGNEASPPDSWSAVDLPEEVRLTAGDGLLSHVVIIWVVDLNNELVVFGEGASGWVQDALAADTVRLRVHDSVYTLRPERITDLEVAFQAYVDRYQDNYPEIIAGMNDPEVVSSGVGFRLRRL